MRNWIKFSFLTILLNVSAIAQTFVQGPALIQKNTTAATAAGTTELTSASQTFQIFTGATTQNVDLPDATSIPVGRSFWIVNESSGVVTVRNFGNSTLTTVSANTTAIVYLRAAGSSNGTWSINNTSLPQDLSTGATPTFAGANLQTGTTTLGTIAGSIDGGSATSFEIPNGAAPTTSVFGQIAADNNAWAASRGALQIYDGTANTYAVGALASDTPSSGQVPTWQTGGTITWETPSSSTATLIGPIVQTFTASATYNRTYVFIITEPTTPPLTNATYTNNGVTFTVARDYIAASGVLYARGNNVPASSGVLTKTGGTGDASVTFSSYRAPLYALAECVGPGGGGGGATGGAAQSAAGGPGGGGSYSNKLISGVALGVTETVTVGTGGTAGAAAGGNGGNGSAASAFGAHCTADPGFGGNGDPSPGTAGALTSLGGAGGSSGTGDVVIPGGYGDASFRILNTVSISGTGGQAPNGGGGGRGVSGNATGTDGLIPGGGASGGTSNQAVNRGGGVGARGQVGLTEFFE